MANNKIQLGDGTVLIDLSGDTITPPVLKRGFTAHNAAGEPITGTMDEGSGGGTDHYVIEGRYTADDSGNITITQIDSLDAATILEGHLDEVYCRLLGSLGGLSFHATHAATSTGVYNLVCRADTAFYLLKISEYFSTEQIPEDTYYLTLEVQGVTIYAAFTVSKIDAVDENDAYIVVNTETQDGKVVITSVTHDSVDKISALASNGKLERIHVVVNDDSGYAVLPGFSASNSTLAFGRSMASPYGSYNEILTVSLLPSAPESQDGVYVEEVELDGNTIYVCYEISRNTGYLAQVARTGSYNDLTDRPTIPTVPTISTDISADAASDVKTASPKAVKSYVDAAIAGAGGGGDMSGYARTEDLADVAFSGDYSDLTGAPEISTNINTDGASDVKTASPKAVKTFVEDKGYQTASQVNTLIDNATIDANTVNGYRIVVSNSAPAAGTANNIITIVV